MRIAFDMDDVLCDFVNAFLNFYNSEEGTAWKKSDIVNYNLSLMLDVSKNYIERMMSRFYESDYFANILPLKGSVDIVKEVSESNELFVISARPHYLMNKTESFIDKFFPFKFEEIVVTNGYNSNDPNTAKSNFCKKLDVSLIVDDMIENISDCCSKGIDALLFDSPWNKDFDHFRVKSWNEIQKYINKKNYSLFNLE